MSIRTERVGRLLQRELALILQNEFADEIPGFVTITHVRVTADLGIAYVYLSIMEGTHGSRDAIFKHIQSLVPRIRQSLAARIRNQVRKIAELKFFIDDTFEKREKLERLFDQISADETVDDDE